MFQKLFPAETAVIDQGAHRQNFLFIRDDHRLTWDLTKNDISHSFHIFPLPETFSQIDETLVRDSHGKTHPLRKQTVLAHIYHIKGLEKEHHSHRIHDDHRDGNLSHKFHGRAERLRDHQNDHHLQDLRLCSQEKQIDAVHLSCLVLFIDQTSQHAFHQRRDRAGSCCKAANIKQKPVGSGDECRHHSDKRSSHDPRGQDADDAGIDNGPAGLCPCVGRHDADGTEDHCQRHLLGDRAILSPEQLPHRCHIGEQRCQKHQQSDI